MFCCFLLDGSVLEMFPGPFGPKEHFEYGVFQDGSQEHFEYGTIRFARLRTRMFLVSFWAIPSEKEARNISSTETSSLDNCILEMCLASLGESALEMFSGPLRTRKHVGSTHQQRLGFGIGSKQILESADSNVEMLFSPVPKPECVWPDSNVGTNRFDFGIYP